MILFHCTTPEAAAAVLRDGFRGGSGSYLFAKLRWDDVVFLSTTPARVDDGAKGEVVLQVDTGDVDMTDYAVEEMGRVWEYIVPASVLNALPPGAVTYRGTYDELFVESIEAEEARKSRRGDERSPQRGNRR
jgi:hypothetical protein